MLYPESLSFTSWFRELPDFQWKTGDRVLSRWEDEENWYPAIIRSIEDERVHVVFDVGHERWTTKDNLRLLLIPLGIQVRCKRKSDSDWYLGHVIEVDGDNVYVEYDDGYKEWTTTEMIVVVQ